MSLAHTAMAGTENQPFQIRFFDVYGFYGTTPPQAIRSSPAASHHSTGITGPSSESSFEIIPHSPNIAPSLQLTSSNNGSDKSDGDSWVIFNNETSSSTGSAGPSITRPRQTTSLEQLSQAGVWDLPPVPEGYYVQQQSTYSGHSPVPIPGHVNQHHPASRMQDSTLDTFTVSDAVCTPPSPLGTWHDLGSGVSSGTLSDQDIFGYPTDIDAMPYGGTETASGASRNGSIDAQQTSIQQTSIHALHTIKKDDSRLWKNWLLNSNNASAEQQLLGIPPQVNLTQFSKPLGLLRKPVRRTPSTAAGCSTPNTSNFGLEGFTRMTESIRVHPRATFCADSTSSNNPHFPSRDFNGTSIAGPERRLKRPIEDTRCAIESSTSTANFAANVYFGNINSSALSPVRVTKKAKRRNIPLGMSVPSETYNLWNGEFNFQPHPTADLMEDEGTHASTEAEQFSPETGSAEAFGLYDNTTHSLDQEIPEQDALNRIDEAREPPDASDYLFCGDFDFLNPEEKIQHSFPISPAIPTQNPDAMEDSTGGDGGDLTNFDLDGFGDVSSTNDISSNPVSPSEHGQVTTPSESPGVLYGPQRPPQSHLTAQQQALSTYQFHANNLPLPEWQTHYAQIAMNWPVTCAYPPQLSQPENPIPENSDEYEAEDEEPNERTGPTTSKLPEGTPRKRKRGAFQDERRVIVGKVREAGACMRCHFLRESCDLGNPCGNCRKVDGKQKIWGNMLCERLNITEAQLFRRGNSKFKQESAALLRVHEQWIPNAETKRLVLGRPPPIAAKHWGKGLGYPGLRIQCREFNPTPKDLLYETWNEDGKEVKYEIPPFAAYDIEDLSDAVKGYVRDTFDLFKHDMISEEHDPLVSLVFREAIRYSDQHQHQCANEGKQGTQEACMLKDALKIWILTRLAYEGYGILEGGDSFGVYVINNPKSPYHETVPIPPILDHQLDTVGIRYMVTLKDSVLRALKKKIAKRRQSQWYEVFLTIFVLLHNLEYVARRQYLYMKRHEYTWAANGEENIAFFTKTWMAEWESAANSLIKHFQVALKGAVPFSFNWERSDNGEDGAEGDGAKPKKKGNRRKKETIDPVDEARKKAGMDDQAVEFMKAVTLIVRQRKAEFQTLQKESDRRQYDKDMVWVSQLFLDVE